MTRREWKTNDSLILQYYNEGRSQRWTARQLKCSKSAVQKRLKKLLPDYGHQDGNNKVTNEIPKPKYCKEYRYLLKKNTAQIFIWTKFLALRSDMQEIRWTGKRFVEVPRVHMPAINDLGGF